MICEFKGKYSWLSNFTKVIIRGKYFTYSSVEHAFVSAKCDDIEWKRFCANSHKTAGQIKKLGRKVQLRSDWDDIKLNVMESALRIKFSQEPFKTLLLNTLDEYIQEGNYWNDSYWGVCLKTNKGENNLGKLIMKIRDELLFKKDE